jgi:hypothetical protein
LGPSRHSPRRRKKPVADDPAARFRGRALHPDRAVDPKTAYRMNVKGIITGPDFFMWNVKKT